jgi:hypothetical protein
MNSIAPLKTLPEFPAREKPLKTFTEEAVAECSMASAVARY